MAMGLLPEGGALRLAGISLPPGQRVYARYGSGGPVAWATTEPVPDAGPIWAVLSGAHQDTGLVPFLASSMNRHPSRPWDDGEFEDPSDPADLAVVDAAAVLQSGWENCVRVLPGEDDKYWRAGRVPFSRTFPGLAPREDAALGRRQVDEILGSLPAARIGLAAAGRPADVLPLIGYTGAHRYLPPLPVAAVLRSWEDRFGARLLRVGFDKIQLLAERPPRTVRAAYNLAAEHRALCDECGGNGLKYVPDIAEYLLTTPIWTFWWD
jgi:Domain of unknown function (DUF4253)